MSTAAGDPSREAGLRRLHEFAHRAGPQYAKARNFDFGPERRGNVSVLSPYLRHRLILEGGPAPSFGERGSQVHPGSVLEDLF